MGIILVNGLIVTNRDTIKGNVRFENGVITYIGNAVKIQKDDEIIDVQGSYILPGAIDTHTHFDLDTGIMKTADNFETGTLAAIAGGTTTILDFATQDKGGTLEKALKDWHEKAENKSFCDYGFHMAITDWNEETAKSMETMVKEGVSSFKMYMAYKGILQVNDGEIYEALKRSKEVGAIIGFHCENGDVIDHLIKENKLNNLTAPKYHEKSRPSVLEAEAISRVSKLARLADSPVAVVHLSSEEGYEEAMRAKDKGTEIYLETCPQYLLLDKSSYEPTKEDSFNGAKYVMSPPLRENHDREALWKALKNNDIDMLGTDHCSFNYEGQKSYGRDDFSKIPNGGPGVEHRLLLTYQYGVLENRISMNQMVSLTSTNAAKLFGIYPKKGLIAVGSDADIVVLNPNKNFVISKENQHQNVDYTPYEGYEIKGNIDYVFLRGEKIIEDNELNIVEPKGKYVKRKAFKGGRD